MMNENLRRQWRIYVQKTALKNFSIRRIPLHCGNNRYKSCTQHSYWKGAGTFSRFKQ